MSSPTEHWADGTRRSKVFLKRFVPIFSNKNPHSSYKIEKSLKTNNPFFGDSGDNMFKTRMYEFFAKLKNLRKMKSPFTLILTDPMANSFIQNPYYPGKDPRCEAVDYERTFEDNELLGLNDIKTENYH